MSEGDETQWQARDLPVPIYLDQRSVFDLLAVLEDGFSMLSSLRTTEAESTSAEAGVEAALGVSNPFALLGVKLSGSGKLGKTKGESAQSEVSREKVHTPTSLFALLRMQLHDMGMCIDLGGVADLTAVTSTDFVEFSAVLERNPIIHAFEQILGLMEIKDMFPDEGGPAPPQQRTSGGAGKKPTAKARPPSNPEVEQMRALLEAFRDPQGTDYVGAIAGVAGARAVVYARTAYFTDENVRQINDGEYRVLGKVLRVVPTETESINLMRNTRFGALQPALLEELAGILSELQDKGLELSAPATTVAGPALLLRPIAIFA